MSMRFAIRFDRVWRHTFVWLGLGPKRSFVAIDHGAITVRMGWAFRMTANLRDVTAAIDDRRFLSRGVHGWRGRYLVNGSGKSLVRLTIDPPARARASLFPVKVRELVVSLDDPDGFLAAVS